MGTFVDNIPDEPFEWGTHASTVSPSSPYQLVNAKFDTTMATAATMLDKLIGPGGNSGYLGLLNSVIETFPKVDVGDFSIGIPALSVSVDNRPGLDLDNLDLDFPEFVKTPYSLSTIPTVDTSSLTPEDLPDNIVAAINWVEENHDTTLFTDLLDRLQSDLAAAEEAIDIDLTVSEITIDSEDGVEAITVDLTPIPGLTIDLSVSSDIDLSDLDDIEIDPSIEDQLWSRALARQAAENDRVQQEIEGYFASRGFDLPPGAMAGRLQEQTNEIARNNTELNEKIMIERAALTLDIAVKNRELILRKIELILENEKTLVGKQDIILRKEDLVSKRTEFSEQITLDKQKLLLGKEDVITKRAEIIYDNLIKQKTVLLQKEEIITKRKEVAQQYKQFIIGASKDLEAVLRDFTAKKDDRKLDYAKAVVAMAIQEYAENIRAYVAAAEAKKTYVQAQAENLRAVIDSNKGLIDQFAAEAQAHGIVIDAKSKANDAIISAFEGDVKGYEAETKAIASNQDSQIKEYAVRVQNAELELRAAIAEAEGDIKSYTAESSLRERVAEAMANIAMQSVASAYGSVNASAGLSYQGSESQSETYSHSEQRSVAYSHGQSLSESHTFAEEAP